jgi:hypothetical protein
MRARRFISRWWAYWLRMSVVGFAAGVLLGGLYDQAPASDFPQAPHAPHATSSAP